MAKRAIRRKFPIADLAQAQGRGESLAAQRQLIRRSLSASEDIPVEPRRRVVEDVALAQSRGEGRAGSRKTLQAAVRGPAPAAPEQPQFAELATAQRRGATVSEQRAILRRLIRRKTARAGGG